MIIGNLFEGLVIRQPTGEIIPGAAHSWEISPDGLTYTFFLREGLVWPDRDKTPLTAGDFSFALYRLFDPAAPSPYAEDFAAIRRARARLSGVAELIGALPRDDHTLVIELEYPDPMFLEKLSSTAAMPCNPSFFAQSRGRYGLETRFVLGNGPFTLGTWDNNRFIHLNRNEHYHSTENVPQSARFYIGRGDHSKNLEEGRSDLALVPPAFARTAQRMGFVMSEVTGGDRLWAIAFNMRDTVWRTALLRKGVSMSIDRGIFDGEGLPWNLPYDTQEAARLFSLGAGMTESPVPQLHILLPDTGGHMQYMQALQQGWQVNLSFFPRLGEASSETLRRRILSGDYQAILLPFEMRGLLEGFHSGSAQNRIGYRNPVYDMFLERAKASHTLEGMLTLLRICGGSAVR
jgi:ABC-type oligopeptide transport system substrate-binding subunit